MAGLWDGSAFGSQRIHKIARGTEVLDENFALVAALHADLADIEIRSLVGSEENVVVGRVFVLLEHLRDDVTAEMVIAAGGEMAGAEDFFVLDVSAGNREHLRAETEFTERAGHRIVLQTRVVGVDGRLISRDERGGNDAAVGDFEHTEGAVLVFHRELAAGVVRDEIHFTGRQVRDIRRLAVAEAVGLLGFLIREAEPCGEHAAVFEGEVDFNRVRLRQRGAEFFRVAGNLVVIHGEAGVKNDVIQTMERRAAEAMDLALRGQRLE